MAVGRRRPTGRGVWPWHARLGTQLLATWIRRRSAFPIHDLAPMRVCRRDDLLALGVEDRRFGYPLELMLRAAEAGWTVREVDVAYELPSCRYQVEGLRLGPRHGTGRAGLRQGAAMSDPTILVVAKAPVPGLAKTRVAATVGDAAAAELAAAALLDTLETVAALGWPVVVAMTGDLGEAVRVDEITRALSGVRVVPQRGDGLGERLAQRARGR